MVAQTVASVGPYALIIRRPADQRITCSGGQASPATIRLRSGRSADNSGSRTGGKVAWVMFCFTMRLERYSPLRSSDGRTSVAPDKSVVAISDTAASKLGDANWRTRAF